MRLSDKPLDFNRCLAVCESGKGLETLRSAILELHGTSVPPAPFFITARAQSLLTALVAKPRCQTASPLESTIATRTEEDCALGDALERRLRLQFLRFGGELRSLEEAVKAEERDSVARNGNCRSTQKLRALIANLRCRCMLPRLVVPKRLYLPPPTAQTVRPLSDAKADEAEQVALCYDLETTQRLEVLDQLGSFSSIVLPTLSISSLTWLTLAVLLEEKVLIVSQSAGKRSSVVNFLRAANFPATWPHLFIGIAPHGMTALEDIPVPFLGAQRYLPAYYGAVDTEAVDSGARCSFKTVETDNTLLAEYSGSCLLAAKEILLRAQRAEEERKRGDKPNTRDCCNLCSNTAMPRRKRKTGCIYHRLRAHLIAQITSMSKTLNDSTATDLLPIDSKFYSRSRSPMPFSSPLERSSPTLERRISDSDSSPPTGLSCRTQTTFGLLPPNRENTDYLNSAKANSSNAIESTNDKSCCTPAAQYLDALAGDQSLSLPPQRKACSPKYAPLLTMQPSVASSETREKGGDAKIKDPFQASGAALLWPSCCEAGATLLRADVKRSELGSDFSRSSQPREDRESQRGRVVGRDALSVDQAVREKLRWIPSASSTSGFEGAQVFVNATFAGGAPVPNAVFLYDELKGIFCVRDVNGQGRSFSLDPASHSSIPAEAIAFDQNSGDKGPHETERRTRTITTGALTSPDIDENTDPESGTRVIKMSASRSPPASPPWLSVFNEQEEVKRAVHASSWERDDDFYFDLEAMNLGGAWPIAGLREGSLGERVEDDPPQYYEESLTDCSEGGAQPLQEFAVPEGRVDQLIVQEVLLKLLQRGQLDLKTPSSVTKEELKAKAMKNDEIGGIPGDKEVVDELDKQRGLIIKELGNSLDHDVVSAPSAHEMPICFLSLCGNLNDLRFMNARLAQVAESVCHSIALHEDLASLALRYFGGAFHQLMTAPENKRKATLNKAKLSEAMPSAKDDQMKKDEQIESPLDATSLDATFHLPLDTPAVDEESPHATAALDNTEPPDLPSIPAEEDSERESNGEHNSTMVFLSSLKDVVRQCQESIAHVSDLIAYSQKIEPMLVLSSIRAVINWPLQQVVWLFRLWRQYPDILAGSFGNRGLEEPWRGTKENGSAAESQYLQPLASIRSGDSPGVPESAEGVEATVVPIELRANTSGPKAQRRSRGVCFRGTPLSKATYQGGRETPARFTNQATLSPDVALMGQAQEAESAGSNERDARARRRDANGALPPVLTMETLRFLTSSAWSSKSPVSECPGPSTCHTRRSLMMDTPLAPTHLRANLDCADTTRGHSGQYGRENEGARYSKDNDMQLFRYFLHKLLFRTIYLRVLQERACPLRSADSVVPTIFPTNGFKADLPPHLSFAFANSLFKRTRCQGTAGSTNSFSKPSRSRLVSDCCCCAAGHGAAIDSLQSVIDVMAASVRFLEADSCAVNAADSAAKAASITFTSIFFKKKKPKPSVVLAELLDEFASAVRSERATHERLYAAPEGTNADSFTEKSNGTDGSNKSPKEVPDITDDYASVALDLPTPRTCDLANAGEPDSVSSEISDPSEKRGAPDRTSLVSEAAETVPAAQADAKEGLVENAQDSESHLCLGGGAWIEKSVHQMRDWLTALEEANCAAARNVRSVRSFLEIGGSRAATSGESSWDDRHNAAQSSSAQERIATAKRLGGEIIESLVATVDALSRGASSSQSPRKSSDQSKGFGVRQQERLVLAIFLFQWKKLLLKYSGTQAFHSANVTNQVP